MEQKKEVCLRTNHIMKSLHVKWTIDNFSFCAKTTDGFVESSEFPVDEEGNQTFYLRLYPEGYKVPNKDYLSIFLGASLTKNFYVKYTVSLLGLDHTKKTESKLISCPCKKLSGFNLFCKRSEIFAEDKDVLKNDSLTVLFEMKLSLGEISSSSEVFVKENSEATLSSGLGELLSSPELVRLQVSGRDYHVHKSVLVARSPVFAAMFQHDMSEARSGTVTIENVQPELMVGLLDYFYTGRVSFQDGLAEHVLPIADMYQLKDIKDWCSWVLQSSLSVSNVVSTLILADRHSLEELKKHVLNFIAKNSQGVLERA